ncbi:hypothetical protein F4778DRAFT_776565 [Xylariomycetidae sp. FL2044]|nr:hypothetical protein F4778DRAFT_776565 [Xylariomycetidae sp. FL2044]
MMRFICLALGLLAGIAYSDTLNYAIPSRLEVLDDCEYPASYEIANFTRYTDDVDGSQNSTSFHFLDSKTEIDTCCQQNSTSKNSIEGTNRWPCDNPDVEFIYQTTNIVGLTVIEKVCPETGSSFEASGSSNPVLNCAVSGSGTRCIAQQSLIQGNFSSLEPIPPSS